MNTILALDSAITGDVSVSKALVREAVSALTASHPARVIYRDLGRDPIPHLTEATFAGVRGQPVTDVEKGTQQLSDELIGELRAADIIVIGAPMYNFSLPTGLRAWFDHVLRAGETFCYTESGPRGLVDGKRVIVIQSRGGVYSEGPAQVNDFQEPYIRHLLGFIGIPDVTFVRAERLVFGAEIRAESIAAATQTLRQLAAEETRRAA